MVLQGVFLYGAFNYSPSSKAQIFSYQGLKVIRTYESQQNDNIFVQDSNDPNNCFSLQKYLSSIPNKYDRNIEELRIKKLVDW